MEKRFVGKVALVTGATNGIGRATAVRLAAEGALVGVNQRPTGDPTETLRLIKEAGGEGFPVVADMRDPEQIIRMVHDVAERGGRLDYVVSNAAINPFMKWDETSLEDFNNLMETNVRGTWVVCTEGAKQMIKEGHGGAICCTSSISRPCRRALPDGLLRHEGCDLHACQGPRLQPRRARNPGQRGRAGLDQDQHERAHVRCGARGLEVLHRPDRDPPPRRARGDGGRHHAICSPTTRLT